MLGAGIEGTGENLARSAARIPLLRSAGNVGGRGLGGHKDIGSERSEILHKTGQTSLER